MVLQLLLTLDSEYFSRDSLVFCFVFLISPSNFGGNASTFFNILHNDDRLLVSMMASMLML